MIWTIIETLAGIGVLIVCVGCWIIGRELVDVWRVRNDMGEFQDPDAEPIDNRPKGPLRWLY